MRASKLTAVLLGCSMVCPSQKAFTQIVAVSQRTSDGVTQQINEGSDVSHCRSGDILIQLRVENPEFGSWPTDTSAAIRIFRDGVAIEQEAIDPDAPQDIMMASQFECPIVQAIHDANYRDYIVQLPLGPHRDLGPDFVLPEGQITLEVSILDEAGAGAFQALSSSLQSANTIQSDSFSFSQMALEGAIELSRQDLLPYEVVVGAVFLPEHSATSGDTIHLHAVSEEPIPSMPIALPLLPLEGSGGLSRFMFRAPSSGTVKIVALDDGGSRLASSPTYEVSGSLPQLPEVPLGVEYYTSTADPQIPFNYEANEVYFAAQADQGIGEAVYVPELPGVTLVSPDGPSTSQFYKTCAGTICWIHAKPWPYDSATMDVCSECMNPNLLDKTCSVEPWPGVQGHTCFPKIVVWDLINDPFEKPSVPQCELVETVIEVYFYKIEDQSAGYIKKCSSPLGTFLSFWGLRKPEYRWCCKGDKESGELISHETTDCQTVWVPWYCGEWWQ